MWRRSLFLLLAGVVAACGHDESRDDVGVDTASDTSDTDAGDTDTGDTDASDTDTDNEIDTAPPEPTGARIVDPAGGSVEGWTVVNRYGRTSSNALGEFTLPFDNDGMTLTLAWPPSRDPAKGTLALLTTYEPDDETPRAEPVITSRTTALALTVLHPALASRDPWHVEHALDAAAASDKVVAVEGAVTSAWQGGQSVLEDPALRGAVAAAAADLGTRIASPFQDAVHLAGPVPRRDLWVHPLDQRGLFEAERAGPDVSFVTAPSYPLALAIDASPVLADGVVTGPDGSRTLAARADLDALEEGATLYDFVSEGPSQPANLFPRAAAAVRGPVTASLGTTASAHVALDERLYHVVAHSGAVAGEGALERWSKAPSTANRGLSLNLAFAARERLATAGVEPSATCLTGAVAVWRSETSSLASAVANDQGPRAAHDGLVALLNGARDCGASAADGFDALAWGLLTELTALADPSDYRFAPYDQRLRYLLHPPSELPTQGALIVAPGDGVTPFAPHVDTAAGSAIDPAKRVTVSPGDTVTLTGRRLGASNLIATFIGREGEIVRAATSAASATSLTLQVPTGLSGDVAVELRHRGGSTRADGFTIAPRLMRIDPAVMPKDSVPRPLTLYGDGFAPGQVVQIGSQAFSLPDTVGPRRAVITVSPVFQPPGDVAVSMQDAPPGTTARLLRILGAPALLSASPAVVAPNALVELTVRDLGRDRDSVTAELLIAGAPSTAAEILTLGPSDSGDTDADRVVIDLGELPTIVATTSATLRLTGSGGTVDVPLSLAARPTATYEREISFFATAPLEVADRFEEAVALTSGSLTPQGIFQQVDTAAWEDGAWYCPVTIGPPAARVPTPCSHFTNICDELWYWEDTSDASEWWDITRPPGLPAGGPRCPEVPGPNSWAGIQGDAIADTVRTNAAVDLAGITIVGRHDTYVLDNASGGGLTIAPPTSGGPSHVTLDATVTDAVGTVITLDGVEDVTIPMLSIVGTNACTTGLHITGSARVRVQTLVVDGCATGLHIEDSQDVVVDAVVILDANRAVFIDQGKRVSVGGFVGLNPVTGQFAASGTDGIVVVGDSRDVAVTPAVVGALSGDGVRIGSASDVFVSVDALGFAAGPNGQLFGQGGSPVTAGASVGTGVRVRPTAERVTIADTHVFQATDGIVIEGARDVVVRRVLAGGSTSHQAATLPPGLSGTGVRVEGAVRNVDIRDVGFGRAPLGGLVVDAVQSADPMTGEVFARGVRSGAGQAGSQIVASVSGCGVWVDSSSGVWLEDVALHGDTVGLCVESSSQLRLLDLGVQDTEATAVALSGSDVELDEAVLLSSGSDAVSVIDAVGLRARLLLVDGAASVGLNVMGTPASASASISVVESSIKNTGLAGVMSTSALQVYLSASEVCEASTTSVDLASSGGGVLHEVAVGRCSTGTPSSKASVGVDASHAVGPVTIRASVIEGHQDAGVRADDAAATIELRESVIRTNSNHGLSVSGETIMRVVDTAFDGNQGDAIALTGLLGEGRLEVEGGAIGTDSPNASAVRSSGCTADSGVPVRFVGVDNADDVVIDGCAAPLELSDSSFGILSMANLQSGTVKAVSGRALSVVDVADARFLDLVLSQGCTIAGAASVRNRARSPEAGELTLLETANNGLAAPDLYSTRYRSDGSWRLVGGNVADHAVVEVWDISGASPRWVGATHVVGGRFDVVLHGLTTDAVFGVASTLPDGSSSPMGGPQTVSPPTTDTCDELAPASDSGDSLWIDERGLADAGGVLVAGATAADRCGDFAVYAANGGLGLLDIGTGELAPFDGFTGVATEPTFSPDCARVAWVGEVAGQVDLFELFVQAPTPVQITDDAAVESGPAYGANNLFFSASSGGEDAAIYAFDASAPTATPALVVDQLGDDEAPSWSPDGDLLAWQRCADDRCEVSVVGLESGVSTVVTRAEGCDDRRPRWQVGPNGDRSLMVRRSAVGAAASSAVVGVNRFGLTLGRLDAGASPAISPVSGP